MANKTFRTMRADYANPRTLTEFETEDLPGLGWIQITDVGEENVYFTYGDGFPGFCKPAR